MSTISGEVVEMLDSSVMFGDCIEILKNIPDESIDHVISDPPYNISDKAKQTMVGPNIVTAEFGDWDSKTQDKYNEWFSVLLTDLFRVSKHGANALLWLDRAYSGVAWFLSKKIGWNPRNIIAAIKNNPTPRMRTKNLKSAWESCLWLSKGPVKTLNWNKSRGLDRNVFNYNIGSDKISDHPTEKYESMIEPLVEIFTETNDIILDPFCGSGTIPVVCKKKNRRYIAIDESTKWIDLTMRRLDTTAKPLL